MTRAVTDLADLIRGEELERLASGFIFTEGPVWNSVENCLVFSDIPGSSRWRWTNGDGAIEVLSSTNKGNGMAYDADGELIVCEHTTSRLVRVHADGSVSVLASHWNGHELNSPNDVVVGRFGDIYFTDPIYGRSPGFGLEREQDLSFQGVYRIDAKGTLGLVVPEGEFEQPNGLCFSPDESLMYINDTPRALIKVFEVSSDGALTKGRLFADSIGDGDASKGVPDGMKCDSRGNVWVTGPGGLWVFSPDGQYLGLVAVPEVVGNFAWGGETGRDLFICASTSLYRITTEVTGCGVRYP